MKKNGLFLIMISLLAVLLMSTACQIWHTQTTPDEIYQSIANFYSLVNDRSDVKEGRFEPWPQEGQKVALTGTVEYFKIYDATVKNVEPRSGILEIKTNYGMEVHFSKKTVPISVNLHGEDTNVPVTFQLVVNQEITKETAERLKSILEAGKKLPIKGRIEHHSGSVSQLEYLQRRVAEVIGHQIGFGSADYTESHKYASIKMDEIYGKGWNAYGKATPDYWKFFNEALCIRRGYEKITDAIPKDLFKVDLSLELQEMGGVRVK